MEKAGDDELMNEDDLLAELGEMVYNFFNILYIIIGMWLWWWGGEIRSKSKRKRNIG